VVCAACGEPFPAAEQWRADDGLACLKCFDSGASSTPTEPVAEPISIGADGLPTLCPGCGKPVGSERIRAAYVGWHPGHAPAEVLAAGNDVLDHPEATTKAPTKAKPAGPAGGTTRGGTSPQHDAEDELSAFGAWLRKPEADGGEGYLDATDAEIAEALRLWALALPTTGGGHVPWSYPTGVATYLLNGWVKRGDRVRQAQGGQGLAALTEDTTAHLRGLDRWKISNHGVAGDHQEGDIVGAWDVNAMYLNAADTPMGIGEPEPECDPPTDWRKRAGWVRLAGPVPHLPYGHDRTVAGQWLPIPIAIYFDQRAEEAGETLRLDRAFVWSRRNTATPLKVLRIYLISARKILGRIDGRPARMAERALKAVYTRALGGLLASPTHNKGVTLRPDWAEQIRAMAVARMLRSLDKVPGADRAVVAFEVDTVVINLSRVEMHETGTPIGLEVVETIPADDRAPWAGKWKPVNSGARAQLGADDVKRAQSGSGCKSLIKTIKTPKEDA
jgi:hypothetical protein